MDLYQQHYNQSTNENTREQFWNEQSKQIDFISRTGQVLDKSNPHRGFWRWFPDWELNISYNCLDRHQDIKERPCINSFSAYTNEHKTYTYGETLEQVQKLAYVYEQLGVQKGDTILIYMPQVAEGIFGMLASSRIGAIHSVVFGGFAAKELCGRILDAKPKLILTASCGFEPKKTIEYKNIIDEALKLTNHDCKILLLQRKQFITNQIIPGRDYDYESCMKFALKKECVPVKAQDPLYILYTSGTTGTPKGIVRETGGTAVSLFYTMTHIQGIFKKDSYFSASDIGWVVGHHFIVYGPLLVGASTLIYEGKPVGTPDASVFWKLIEKYQVNGLYTAPTALRVLRREDLEGKMIKKYNISSLKNVSMAGERCDIPTYNWIHEHLKVLINDNYWQTEVGWMISCNYANLTTFKFKAGSAIKPAPGFNVQILEKDSGEIITQSNKLGKIAVKLPMPPGFMLGLWKNDEVFKQKYLEENPGYYITGDAGYFDDDQYLNVMTRLDDIINTAGHRLSTAQMEEVLLSHQDIIECAVVARQDALKGEVPVGFVVKKQHSNISEQDLQTQCVQLVRKEIGALACFSNCIIVEKLPKTRSGKTLRSTIKKIIDGVEHINVPSTIEDSSTLQYIYESLPKLPKLQKLQTVDQGIINQQSLDKVYN